MNWEGWGPTLVAIVTAIYMAGQITGRIKSQENTLKHHDERLNSHDAKLENQAERIARAESWSDGYKARDMETRIR